jgi:zinc protease
MRFATALRFAALAVAFVLASCVQQGPGAQVEAGGTRGGPEYSFWPHEVSDIGPDPAVRIGVLSNGLRFAIMRNAQPAGTVSLRLRIAAGSLQESDAQRGLAHFMEHMAFNGSKNVPEGEFVKLLQRRGLAFGAHTNAFTSFGETVYQLELPRNDADTIDTGLMLFREIGGRLTLDPAAIEREKGVVLSEQRTRSTPEYRAFESQYNLLYEGQRQPLRLPIGTVETIKGATRELLADYYRKHYRPERTLLVVTGDMDVAEIEAKVRAKFGDWQGEGPESADPGQGPLKKRGLVGAAYSEPNLGESVNVTWLSEPDTAVDTVAERALSLRRQIAFAIIGRRMGRVARESNPPFINGGVGYDSEPGLARSFRVFALTRPGGWRRGLEAAEQEYRRAVEFGFSEAEVAREIKEWRAALEDAVAKVNTRETKDLADQLTSFFNDRKVFTPPADQLARFERAATTITPATVLEALRGARGAEGPVVFVASGNPVTGGNQAVAAAFEGSVKTAVKAPSQLDAKAFPYSNFGAAGSVVSRQEAADLGVTMIRFGNGVMLNLKPTTFDRDTIFVTARFAGGLIRMPRDKIGLSWALPFGFVEGGLKQLTTDELEEALAGRIVSSSLSMDEEAFDFDGRTNKRDLLLQMQLLAAFATDPAYRGNGLERVQAAADSYIKQYSSSSGRVLARETGALLRSGDPRWAFPTLAGVNALKISDVEKVMTPVLASAPIEITVVGDFVESEVVAAVAQTFGALPKRAAQLAEPAGARDVRFPSKAKSVRFSHEGRADQASAFVAWPGPDFYSNPRRARTISVLREVIDVRLTEEFREVQGATYSPSVSSTTSSSLPGFGYISASAETKAELVEGFFATVNKIVAEVKAGAFSDDVLTRARTPILKSIETSRLTNDYWFGAVNDVQSDPRSLETIRSQLKDYETITKAEVVAAAQAYLVDSRRVEVRVAAGGSAGTTGSGQ